ncbi:MAG: extracellular solute-binding protein [Treponema sp.]|jgi:multiple sugar transport system substrate-binding protein|nr:extracellular solute-binding protein [Treponema sp.]
MKKLVLCAALLVAASLVFAGARRQAAAPGGERIKIRFTEWDGGDTLETFQEMANNFNRSQDRIEAEIINIPTDYDTKMMAMIAAGDVPELAHMETATIMYPLADEGYIVNLLDIFKTDPGFDPKGLFESLAYWRDANFLAGYGPAAETFGVFFNTELFAKYNVPVPAVTYAQGWTWEAFLETARKLTIDNKGNNALSPNFDPNNIVTYGVTFGKWFGTYWALYNTTGGPYLAKNNTQYGLFTPEGIDAMQRLADLIYKYHVSPTPTQSDILPGMSEAFLSGKVAMALGEGQWANASLMFDGVAYDVAPMPRIKQAGSTITAGANCVMNTSKKEAAWEFFKFMLTPGSIRPLEQSGLWLPNHRSELEASYLNTIITSRHPKNQYEAFYSPLIDGSCGRAVSGVIKNFNQVNDEFSAMLDPLWMGQKTYQQLVTENEARINALVQGYRETGSF